MSGTIGSEIIQILVFGAVSYLFLRFANKKGYFSALNGPLWDVPIEWYQVLGVFAIYFGVSYFVAPIAIQMLEPILIRKSIENGQIFVLTWFNFINSLLILALILMSSAQVFKAIWRKSGEPPENAKDIKAMFTTLILVFPVILCVSSFIDLVVRDLFGLQNLPDQIAVQWLKMSFENPLYFVLTALSIVVIAPLLEETLFRGFLQSFLRQRLGPKYAIGISSFLFACFHYSMGQGWNNIPIIVTLLPLAFFLGYLYEKQKSLFASISLHAAFNTISLTNIYFFGHFL